MEKPTVIQAIVDTLICDYNDFKRASIESRGGGSDAQSRSEGKYDTRSTEANYLADGQARQAEAAAKAAAAIKELLTAPARTTVGLGALIEIDFGANDREWFLIGPSGGGVEVTVGGQTITVITPESVMGKRLAGLSKGIAFPGMNATLAHIS